MKVLITEAASPLGLAVKEELETNHELRLVAEKSNSRKGIRKGNLLDPAGAMKAVTGMDAVIYISGSSVTSPPTSPDEEHADLDSATRGAYNLYKAAIAAGVKRIVHVSSMTVMDLWPKEYVVTENWRPRPSANSRSLGFHLAEEISREITRESEMAVVCLRMATLVREKDVVGQPFDPMWLDISDAASACQVALEWNPKWSRWIRAHIGPVHPYAVWPSLHTRARFGEIEWRPQHNFEAWWPKADAAAEGVQS